MSKSQRNALYRLSTFTLVFNDYTTERLDITRISIVNLLYEAKNRLNAKELTLQHTGNIVNACRVKLIRVHCTAANNFTQARVCARAHARTHIHAVVDVLLPNDTFIVFLKASHPFTTFTKLQHIHLM